MPAKPIRLSRGPGAFAQLLYHSPAGPICPTCGKAAPRLVHPIPPGRDLSWDDLTMRERQLMAGLIVDHRTRPFDEWRPRDLSERIWMTYKQVTNSLRRLVQCGWVTHVARGVYRLSETGQAKMSWVKPLWTRKTIHLHNARKDWVRRIEEIK